MSADPQQQSIDALGATQQSDPAVADAPHREPGTHDTLVGQRLGPYVVRRKLGEGGMGAVFECVHESIGQRAAIKVLHPRLSSDGKVSARFLNEARATGIIRHPGLVKIYDHQTLPDGTVCLVMELLEGESLEDRLVRMRNEERRFSRDQTLQLVTQAASALQAAHAAGIVHCDLKPANIFLVPDPAVSGGERVKLLDFGIAKFLSAGEGGQTTTVGLVMGTPRYMSPEQCEGRDKVDSKVDVYALGVILYELLAGAPPFEAASPTALMRQHMNLKPPQLRERAPDAGDGLCALVHAMLTKDGAARPSMDEVLRRLQSEALAAPRQRRARAPLYLAAVLLPLLGLWAWYALWRPQRTPAAAPAPAVRPAPASLPAPQPPSPAAASAPTVSASAPEPPPALPAPVPAGKHRPRKAGKRDAPKKETPPASSPLKEIKL